MSWNWCWFTGLLWIECKQLYSIGLRAYITVYQKLIDFSVLSMYLASYVLRFFTEYKISQADRSDFSPNRTTYTTPQLHNIQHAPFLYKIKYYCNCIECICNENRVSRSVKKQVLRVWYILWLLEHINIYEWFQDKKKTNSTCNTANYLPFSQRFFSDKYWIHAE